MEAGFDHTHRLLRGEVGSLAMTLLINMIPSEGRNSIQKHLREHLSKVKDFDELEEELHAELYRRETENKTDKGIKQLETCDCPGER